MFWNKEKIEVCKDLPRMDASPLEALFISGELDGQNMISNIFLAMLVQLYAKKVIKINKKENCIIEFNYDNVDMFSSKYKKTMEDYSLLKNVRPMFNEEIGFFYNELVKLTDSSKVLMDELKISLDELGFLNLLKVVAYENDNLITIELLYKTLMKRDTKSIKDMGIESIIFFFSKLLPQTMFEKGYITEKVIKVFDNSTPKSTEKFESESKLWKGFKKYLKKDIYGDMSNLSMKTIMDFCPYAIVFGYQDLFIENMVSLSENSSTVDVITIDTIDSINKEIKILDNMMLA